MKAIKILKAKETLLILMIAMAFLSTAPALARDERFRFPVAEALTMPDAQEQLEQGVKFFFGDAAHPEVERSFGVFTSNKKTNAFNKSDKQACEWAFLSAMLSFQDRALAEGGDAVINIESYYKTQSFSSATEYECGAGNIMAGLTFRGEVVKLSKY